MRQTRFSSRLRRSSQQHAAEAWQVDGQAVSAMVHVLLEWTQPIYGQPIAWESGKWRVHLICSLPPALHPHAQRHQHGQISHHPAFPFVSGLPRWASEEGGALVIRVKAVPGASRDVIAGPLGDRLKVRVAAPPEGGKANASIERLVAQALGVPERAVRVIHGHASPQKVLRVQGADPALVRSLDGDAPAADVGENAPRP